MTKRPKALGKGLGALIPQRDSAAFSATGDAPPAAAIRVRLSDIHANPDQPRRYFNPEKLEELAASIKEQGLLQPLLVRRKDGAGYELIAGERRLRAAKAAGLDEVPVIVRSASDKEVLELALVENLQRDDLNPIELAQGYQALLEDYGYSQEQLARRVGRDRSSVANALRLLKLPSVIQQDLIEGRLSAGHAKALLSVDDPDDALALRDAILDGGLSVRAAEESARHLAGDSIDTSAKRVKKSTVKKTDPDVAALITRLERKLGCKVEIQYDRKGKGRITIRYAGLDQLQPILDKLES